MEDKEVYHKRDVLLGRIDERTEQIPVLKKDIKDLHEDVKDLHGRMVRVEVKSGLWGIVGGMAIFAVAKVKSLLLVG